MRVITGSARGRRLITVPGSDLVRPTSEKVKEGLFSSIQFDIEGRRILDLFAGCGQLAIEALSRGAVSCTFCDASEVSLGVVRQNIKNCGFENVSRVVKSDYASYLLRCNEKYDIIFMDPPYKSGMLENALNAAEKVLSDYGKIICEHPDDVVLPETAGGITAIKNLKYGKITVTVFQKGANAQ